MSSKPMRYRVVEEISGSPRIENDSAFAGDTPAERRAAAEAECARLNGASERRCETTSWVPGPYRYDECGAMIVADNPYGHGEMRVADLRGWGHLTGHGDACGFTDEKAEEIQNATGRMLARAPSLMPLVLRLSERHCSMFSGEYTCAEMIPHDRDRWCDPCTACAALTNSVD